MPFLKYTVKDFNCNMSGGASSGISGGTMSGSNQSQKVVIDLKWNKEGNYLGVISADKTVRVGQLDQKNGGIYQNIHTIPTYSSGGSGSGSGQMAQLCWSPTEIARLAFCGDDKQIELWDVRGNLIISTSWIEIDIIISYQHTNLMVFPYGVYSPLSGSLACKRKDEHARWKYQYLLESLWELYRFREQE